jgi:predicted membrane protein
MSTNLFWGILLIVIGGSLILKIVFNWDFSIFRVIVAFVLIYLGIRLFVGKDFNLFSHTDRDDQVVFSEKTIHTIGHGKEYNVVFGSAKFDLTDMAIPDSSAAIHVKINTVFGGTWISIDPKIPFQVQSNTVFGGTQMPNNNSAAFGSLTYETDSAARIKPRLIIEANTVFGGLAIKKN